MPIAAAGIVTLTALGGTGLAGDGIRVVRQCGDRLRHADHSLLYQIKSLPLVLNHIHDLGLGLLQHFTSVGIQNRLDKVGTITGSPVGNGSGIGRQLHRADHGIALANGRLDIQGFHIVGVVLGGQVACGLADLHAGALAQAQLIGVGIVDITGQAAAHIIEEDIAAPLDCVDHINGAVAMAVLCTFGAVILIVGIDPGTVDRGIAVNEPGIQRGDRHSGFEGGTRSIQAL